MADKKLGSNLLFANNNVLSQHSRSNYNVTLDQSSKVINTDITSINDLFKRAHSESQRNVLESSFLVENNNSASIKKKLDLEKREGSHFDILGATKSPTISDFRKSSKVNDHVVDIKGRIQYSNYKINDVDLRSSSHLKFADKLEQKEALRKKDHYIEDLGIGSPTIYGSLDNLYSKNNDFERFVTYSPVTLKININNTQNYPIRNILRSSQLPADQEYNELADKKIINTSQRLHNALDGTKTLSNDFSFNPNENINKTDIKNTLAVKQWQDDEKNSELLKLNRLKKRFNSIKQRKDKLYSSKSAQSNQSEAMNVAFETQKTLIQNNVNNLYFEKRFSIHKRKSDAIKKNKDVENTVASFGGKIKYVEDSIEHDRQKVTLEEPNIENRNLIMKVTTTPRENARNSSKGEFHFQSNGYHQLVIPNSIGNVNLRSNDDDADFINESKINNETFFQELNEDEDGKKSIHSKLENILKERMSSINGKVHEKKPAINQQLFSNKHTTTNESTPYTATNDNTHHTTTNETHNLINHNSYSKFSENLEEIRTSSSHPSNFNNSAVEYLNEKKKTITPYQTLRFGVEDKEELKKRETLINEIKAAVLSRTIETTSKKPQEVYTPHKLLANVDFIDHTKSGIEIHDIISVDPEVSVHSVNTEYTEDFKGLNKPEAHFSIMKNASNSFENLANNRDKKYSTSRVHSPTSIFKLDNYSPTSKSLSPTHSVKTSPKQERVLNRLYHLNELQTNKPVKKIDLRPINKGAVVEMLNFHLLDKNGWDRLDETRRFLTENQSNPQHLTLLDDENSFIKSEPFHNESGQPKSYQSNSPRMFSLTDSDLLIGLQINSGETNRSEKNVKSNGNGIIRQNTENDVRRNTKNDVRRNTEYDVRRNTECDIFKTAADARQLIPYENYENNETDFKNNISKIVMETKQPLLPENDWQSNNNQKNQHNYQNYQNHYKNTRTVGSQFNSLDTKYFNSFNSRVIDETKYLTKDEYKFENPFADNAAKYLSSDSLDQKNNQFEFDSEKYLKSNTYKKQQATSKSLKLQRSNSFIKPFENNEPLKLDKRSTLINGFANYELEKPELSDILKKQLENKETIKIIKSYTLPNKFKNSDSGKLDKTDKTFKMPNDNKDSINHNLYEINNNLNGYEINVKTRANNMHLQYEPFKMHDNSYPDPSFNNTRLHRTSPDIKWNNEYYTAANIGKVTIPKYLENEASTRSTRPTTPTIKTNESKVKPQTTDDLFEVKKILTRTDQSTNESKNTEQSANGLRNTDPSTTSKPSTPRKLSLRLKQLFSPTQKRKESLFSSDEDISRRKNINKTGGFGFQNIIPLNQSEDDIYENFISNEEWRGMKDSWKSRAWVAFNQGSLRSKDDLDSFSIKKQPKIRKPLSINTFSQRIRKDKMSVTEIPISFVSKNQLNIDKNLESLSKSNNKYKTK